MATTQGIGEGLTFEKVWAAIQATHEEIQETSRIAKETTQQVKEIAKRFEETERSIKETDRQMKETDKQIKETERMVKETSRQMKETDKRFGFTTNRFGEVVEYMILPNLVTKFDELGFTFTKANRTKITDRKHDIIMEIDALLENGDTVMAVEIKTKPNDEDINDHIERMEKLRRHADLHNDKRRYLGAMAGVVFSESAKTYALKKGFYVIEPSGETFVITEPRGVYRPGEW
jgi:small-conductance mechanosensitive channel